WSRRVAKRAAPAASETYSRRRSGSAMSTSLTSPWPITARPERPRPEPASASSTSKKRALLPLRRRRVVPSRSRLRHTFTEPDLPVSSTSTSARPTERLPVAPWKMRSVLSSALNAAALPPPVVQRSASMMLDLPDPFGPMIAVTPGANSIVVRSPKLLKPCRVSDAIRTPQDNPLVSGTLRGRRSVLRRYLARVLLLASLLVLLLVLGQAPESRVLQLAAQLPLQLGDPVLHVALQLVQPLPEPDDLLDPRQVHAQLLRQAPYLPQLLDVALRVEPGLAAAAAGFDEALALVE